MTLTDPVGPAAIARIPSVAEARLSAAEAARLPVAPQAPWQSDVEATVWWHVAAPRAHDVLPPPLAQRSGLPITIAAAISYRSSPVGPYREVFGAPVMLRGRLPLTHCPFMAVDSPASVAGGRRNWALPKVAARFDGEPGRTGEVQASGRDWAISITTSARRRRLPAAALLAFDQVWPDGRVRRFVVRWRGAIALATVEVEHLLPSGLRSWLAPGRHGALMLSGTQVVLSPQP